MSATTPVLRAAETADNANAIKTVELDWFADNDVVSVTPRSQIRFNIQKDRAIEILQREKDAAQFGQQFSLLLERLAKWVSYREPKIERAILTLQDNALAFVVVRTAVEYDEDFQDELADLDIEVANDPDLQLISLKTLGLPHVTSDALRSFLDERLVLEYVERSRPHQPS